MSQRSMNARSPSSIRSRTSRSSIRSASRRVSKRSWYRRLPVPVGGGEEEHVAAFDEGPIAVVDPVAHEPLIDPVGQPASVEAILVGAAAVVEERHRGLA